MLGMMLVARALAACSTENLTFSYSSHLPKVARALAACLTENLTFSYSSHLPKVGWNDS